MGGVVGLGVQACAHSPPVPVAEGHVPAQGRNRTAGPCTEYTCGDGECIAFKQVRPRDRDPHPPSFPVPWWGPRGVLPIALPGAQHRHAPQVCNGLPDCGDGDAASGWVPSDERDCGHWGPWAPWGACSRSCGPGQQLRARGCSQQAPDVLHQCHGEATQARPCFSTACPGGWARGCAGGRRAWGIPVTGVPGGSGGFPWLGMPRGPGGGSHVQGCWGHPGGSH